MNRDERIDSLHHELNGDVFMNGKWIENAVELTAAARDELTTELAALTQDT